MTDGWDWRTFEKARAFARGLGLKGTSEWSEWAKSGGRLDDIPSNPSKALAVSLGTDEEADEARQGFEVIRGGSSA